MNYEVAVYEQILPSIQEAASNLRLDMSQFCIREMASYSSVYFGQVLIFRIRCRGKKDYLAIPGNLKDLIPDSLEAYTVKSDDMIRLPIQSGIVGPIILSLSPPMIEAIVTKKTKSFDCCAYYEACSDARQCVLTDLAYSMQCGYKRILKEGKVYFGKNRNV